MNAHHSNTPVVALAARQRGVTLIELLVALTISSVLVFGATQVYVKSRNTYQTNESVTRLQETARYAMSIVEVDVRNANYFGLTKSAYKFVGQAAQTPALGPVAPGAAANICGDNFAIDLNTSIQGDNNSYVLSLNASRKAGCNALSGWATVPVTTADTLTIRRASVLTQAAFTDGTLQLCSGRGVANQLFSTAGACAVPPIGQINNLIVNAYYVDRNSVQAAGLPSLRRKALAAGPAFIDEEVIAGVEDMQVQFGIEDINPDPAIGALGLPSRYIDPAAVTVNQQVVSVRIWLLIRADTPELGFSDNRCYAYAARVCANGVTADLNNAGQTTRGFQPSSSADNSFTGIKRFRRLLMSRTMYLRDAYGN
jgi:type IV pilus assembly protein PilW